MRVESWSLQVNNVSEVSMKSVVMVVAPSVFRDEEYAEPKAVLEASGATVVTASTSAGTVTGRFGLTAEATVSVADAALGVWDAAVFIGGAGASVFFDDPDAHGLARRTLAAGGVIGAICIAPATLARAGLLQGIRATAFTTQRDDLTARGATWRDDPVVVDGHIVTANGPEAASAFGHAIASALALQP
ncbi:MAG: DJ-1/PfpI family protein [Coriobacteriia bacterium]|nr:DJ-1/PfpI family protein [Coriobacteriia bacterium]